jgi:hypothetical protein
MSKNINKTKVILTDDNEVVNINEIIVDDKNIEIKPKIKIFDFHNDGSYYSTKIGFNSKIDRRTGNER